MSSPHEEVSETDSKLLVCNTNDPSSTNPDDTSQQVEEVDVTQDEQHKEEDNHQESITDLKKDSDNSIHQDLDSQNESSLHHADEMKGPNETIYYDVDSEANEQDESSEKEQQQPIHSSSLNQKKSSTLRRLLCTRRRNRLLDKNAKLKSELQSQLQYIYELQEENSRLNTCYLTEIERNDILSKRISELMYQQNEIDTSKNKQEIEQNEILSERISDLVHQQNESDCSKNKQEIEQLQSLLEEANKKYDSLSYYSSELEQRYKDIEEEKESLRRDYSMIFNYFNEFSALYDELNNKYQSLHNDYLSVSQELSHYKEESTSEGPTISLDSFLEYKLDQEGKYQQLLIENERLKQELEAKEQKKTNERTTEQDYQVLMTDYTNLYHCYNVLYDLFEKTAISHSELKQQIHDTTLSKETPTRTDIPSSIENVPLRYQSKEQSNQETFYQDYLPLYSLFHSLAIDIKITKEAMNSLYSLIESLLTDSSSSVSSLLFSSNHFRSLLLTDMKSEDQDLLPITSNDSFYTHFNGKLIESVTTIKQCLSIYDSILQLVH